MTGIGEVQGKSHNSLGAKAANLPSAADSNQGTRGYSSASFGFPTASPAVVPHVDKDAALAVRQPGAM
jgi:hypothetical protein